MIQGLENVYNISEVSIYYKVKAEPAIRQKVTCCTKAYDILLPYFGMDIEVREKMFALLLNNANEVISVYKVSEGGICATVADMRLIMCAAVHSLAVGIIIAHNHPSGNLTPSRADIELTKKLKEGAQLLDIKLLDHLIMSDYAFTSMSDEGHM